MESNIPFDCVKLYTLMWFEMHRRKRNANTLQILHQLYFFCKMDVNFSCMAKGRAAIGSSFVNRLTAYTVILLPLNWPKNGRTCFSQIPRSMHNQKPFVFFCLFMKVVLKTTDF